MGMWFSSLGRREVVVFIWCGWIVWGDYLKIDLIWGYKERSLKLEEGGRLVYLYVVSVFLEKVN